jgi:large subunit ribosomal protein L18
VRPTDKPGRRRLRHARLRSSLRGTAARPRLAVYRSLKHVYAQLVDDDAGKTLAAASSLSGELKDKLKNGGNRQAAAEVGGLIARRATALGITRACFDRGGFRYHGCVAAVADAARKAGLEL